MKKLFAAVLLLAVYLPLFAASLTTADAARHIGENATVCGVVAGVHTASGSRGSPTFVNLDKPYPHQVFTILIWGSDLNKFNPVPSTWDGKRVCATGLISSYRGVPEIIARTSTQVSF